jgi:hypothetical protein
MAPLVVTGGFSPRITVRLSELGFTTEVGARKVDRDVSAAASEGLWREERLFVGAESAESAESADGGAAWA